jgi:hypothetical protein
VNDVDEEDGRMPMSNEDRELARLEAELEDLAESRRALRGLERLGRPWAVAEGGQIDARLSEAFRRHTELTTKSGR